MDYPDAADNSGSQIVIYQRRKHNPTSSDDDFENPDPIRIKRPRTEKVVGGKKKKKQKREKGDTKSVSPQKKKKKSIDYTSIRVSPSVLVRAISYLSDAQRKWVESIGLGVFLRFNFNEMPHRLGFRIVQSLNTGTMHLQLRSGSVRIREEDVAEILGLPRGVKKLDISKPNKTFEDKWAQQFGKTGKSRLYIYAEDVLKKIADENEVTNWFKCNFLVIVFNTLIRASTHAAVDRHILRFRENFDELAQYNWCRTVLESIKDSKDKWEKNPRVNYTGPLLFLLLLYVDRVIYKDTRVAARTVPIWLSWTDALLQKRSSNDIAGNKFGVGVIEKGLWQELINAPPLDFVAPEPQPSSRPPSESDPDPPQTENQTFKEDLFQKFKRGAMDLVSCIYNYNGMLSSSPLTVITHPEFQEIQSIVLDASKRIQVVNQQRPASPHTEHLQQQYAQKESNIQETVAEKEPEGGKKSDEINDAEEPTTQEPTPFQKLDADIIHPDGQERPPSPHKEQPQQQEKQMESNIQENVAGKETVGGQEQQKTQEATPINKLDPTVAEGGKSDFYMPPFDLLLPELNEPDQPVPEAAQPDSEEHPKSDEISDMVTKMARQYDQPEEKEAQTNKNEESKIEKGKEKMDVAITEIPILRQDPRPAPALLSPFVERDVRLGIPPSATEKLLVKWINIKNHPNI